MSSLDIIILVLIGYGAVRGYMKGVIMELVNILAIIVGLFATIHFSHFVGSYLSTHFSWDNSYIKPVAFVITFIAFLLVIQLIARLIDQTLKKIGLGIFIRIAGILVGMIKIILIIGSLLFVLQYLNTRTNNQLFDGKFLSESHLSNCTK